MTHSGAFACAAAIDRCADELATRSGEIAKASEASPIGDELEGIGGGLEILTEVIGGLQIDDATLRTRILEGISEVMGALNRARALLDARRRELRSAEGMAEFGVQFKLLRQAVAGALAVADTPEKCDA